MGPDDISEAGSQLNVLLDLVSDPKKYAEQAAKLQALAKAASDAAAANQAILDETKRLADQANADKVEAADALKATKETLANVTAVRDTANRTLADVQNQRNQLQEDDAALTKAKQDHQANVTALAARSDAIAKRERELDGIKSLVEAKESEWNAKLGKLKEITG